MGSKNKKLNLDYDTLYDLYVVQQMDSSSVGEILGCSSKSVRNYLSKYGIPIRQNGDAVKLQRSHWSQEKELNRSLKFMKTWRDKPKEERDRQMSLTHSYTNTPQTIQKARDTKFKNNTYKKSIAEDKFYDKLLMFFEQDDIVRGYVDNRYPYNCDFYIKSKDLFIEYQGHYTHGYEPYDETNIRHIEYLEDMQSRGIDMTTWTTRDVTKLKTAKRNKIKLLLIYPKNNSYFIKNGNVKNINKIDVFDINDIE